MLRLAIVPARGGSKRIPRKNIRIFRGRPMIAWSIAAALKSGMFDRVIVSTDDQEIADIAIGAKAEVPFIRPDYLADDQTPTVPVIAHAIEELAIPPETVQYVCCIYPCAPFLNPIDLANAAELLDNSDAAFVYPVVEYPHPVQRAMRRIASGKMQFFQPEHELSRTQDLETAYHDAGQFYLGEVSAWLSHLRMHTDGLGMPIPAWRVVDIDDEAAWKRAEILHQLMFPSGDTVTAIP